MASSDPPTFKRHKLREVPFESSKFKQAAIATDRFPYEVLGDIFRRALRDSLGTSEGDQQELMNVMLVCRHWCGAAIVHLPDVNASVFRDQYHSLPSTLSRGAQPAHQPRQQPAPEQVQCGLLHQLWRRFAFDIPGHNSEEELVRRCKLWFSRAAGFTLGVKLFMQGWTLDERMEGDLAIPTKLWEYLANVPQLRSLSLKEQEILSVFELLNHSWGYLEHLSIDFSKIATPERMHRNTFIDSDHVSRATANCMWAARSITVDFNAAPQQNNLATLTLHAYVSSFFALSFLEESPSLQKLDLNLHPKGYRWEQPEDEHAIMWKDVQRRKRISLPKLHDLALSNLTAGRRPTSLEGSTSTLKRLNIRDLDIDDWGLLELLRNYPLIRSLTLYRLEHVDGPLFDELLLYENCGVLTMLHSLDIAGNWKEFDTEALV
ncbi:hypothetical protein FA13DRAFT_1777998 [Coprinellus micaceus]|uniref:Uncharacterized protein n=1 Tax=Coprinellus micaceus TaxID=71717 RepID=A0A4Y7SQE7_COPMI|nr:hypothetical protein FA13DRAFT_1777998 [Coprinellus micaceus]